MKRWVTIFPNCKNFHLIKDVGYIPYIMNRNYNFNSSVVTFNEDEYKYTETYLKGLNVEFLSNKIKNDKLAIIWYLIKNSRNIDVLNLFHLKPKHLIYFYLYKSLNRNGKTYLKLDANETIKDINLNAKNIKSIIYKKFLKYCDVISVETIELHKWLQKNWQVNVEYIPNGFWENKETDSKNYLNLKKNYITTVGRLGSEHKNNEILIDAFKRIYKDIPKWKLCLVGEMTYEFKIYVEDVFLQIPELKDKIIFKGYVDDLNELDNIYNETKIFCLTSTSESFGLVFVEALKNGCYIITSNVLAAKDVTNDQQFGCIFDYKNQKQLEDILKSSCINYDTLANPTMIQDFAYDNFNWNKICDNIYKCIGLEE